ncbi:hypothetical protein H0E87_023752 [Populus deltoides]|uniref:Uncharacterized protein n=1 Tax=Populus deltoides TaxID=3696 RepID=A0A8T2X4Y3_POPDE|nr:hypothetical protein H0E87_023752 [Populus deltoides]
MGEIRSPYFSIDQEHLKDNAEIRSPYFSSGGDYLGTFFHNDNIVENPYNAENFVEQDIVQNIYNTEKLRVDEIEKLYLDLEAGEEHRTLASKYLNRYNAGACKLNYNELDELVILHFTDLVRSSLSVNHPPLRSDEPIGKFYSATKLHEAAINFKEFRDECLLNVKFSSTKRELRIPRLRIDHHTELLFGNLIALEQCLYKGEDQYICHYVKLLDTLVAKPKDADLLIKNKIIDTDRDGASVKNLIDRLSAETSEEYSIYDSLYKRLDQHYQHSWLKNSAYFREVYFGNLWRSTATVSAAVLLLFTFVQTICAVVALR